MINFRVSVTGAGEAAERLRRKAARLRALSGAFVEAGFFLLVRIWDRISSKPTTPPTYSDRYVRWLIAHGDWSGKMVGILSGALIAQSAPSGEGQASGELETAAGADFVEVGFLNPSGKARGFLAWFKRRFGEEAIEATRDDQRQICEIFERWIAERA